MAQRLTGHIFISYSRKDTLVLRRIVESLRKQGMNIWMDNEQLEPGTPVWEEEIEQAIKEASAIVVLMSPDSKISEWVRREISYSEQYRKHIFPVLIGGDEESSITLRLITRQYVDIRQDEVEGLHLLNVTLKAYLEGLNTQEERLAAAKAETERKAVMPQEVHLTTSETGGSVEEKSVVTSGLSELAQASRQTKTRKIASPHKWS
ncbi:MAG TPA: toll/interleukin-1 receptor domain-containing protein, partial [Anaerolineales bacterium]|nr:toll/interleukin-1 receptor domain-containing protein [Anaerolineales bacterium]